ncbi:hypothetical protein N9W17_01515 [Jannaschia sp.]|nr:hypothetical protein [Jannaschia sp.]
MAVFSEPPDFPDTGAVAPVLTPGDSAIGSFGTPSDQDAFRLRAELGFDYTVSVTARDDSALVGWDIRARDTQDRFGNAAEGTETGAAITLTAADLGSFEPRGNEARDFVVTLGAFDGNAAAGDYSLSVLREEDSTAATRVSIAPGESYDGAWEYRGDIDLIGLELVAGRTYAASLDIFNNDGLSEVVTLNSRSFDIRAPSDDGVRGAFFDTTGSSNSKIISFRFEATETGTYFLRSENDSREFDSLNFGAETGNYTVSLVEDEPADETSPLRLEVGTPVIDTIDFLGDEDVYGADLQGGITYDVFFGVETDEGLSGSFVEIFDAEGTEVERINTRLPNSFLDPIPPVIGTFTPSEDGLYFFSGVRFSEVGEYRLEVSAPPLVLIGSDDVADRLDGEAGNDSISGLGLNDVLRGFGGSDSLDGGSGNDTLEGGVGNDTLDGGAGADRMVGGAGDDVFVVNDRGDVVIGGDGRDSVATAIDFQIRRTAVEEVQATGDSNVRLTGTNGDETLIGNEGSNILIGNGGADVLTGAGGSDFFVINGTGGVAPALTIADFTDGDKLAIDDQLLGLGNARVDVRDLTFDVVQGLLRDGTADYNGRSGELSIDIDGEGRAVVATLEGGGRIGLDDILLF